jgi:signal transduction histidine kinase/FixJ family two-component response regulator/HPt (histidine-containing phosphotransfer) domain-containing protein
MRTTNDTNRLNLKFTLFFVFIIALLIITQIVTTTMQLKNMVQTVCNSVVIPVAHRAAAMVDGDDFERLCQTLDETDPFYEETRKKLLALKEESGCAYLYTMDRIKDPTPFLVPHGIADLWSVKKERYIYRFIIDGSAPPGHKEFSPLGIAEDVSQYNQKMLLIWDNQMPQIAVLVTQKWGSLISAWIPISNSAGDMVGIIGVDFDALEFFSLRYFQIFGIVAVVLLCIVMGVMLFVSLFRSLSQQNAELQRSKTMADISARSIASLLDEVQRQNHVLLELKQEADAATEAKSSFLASTSHEIRTPMNAVIGMSELALRETDAARKDEFVREIKQAGHNLLSIINDILDFSKIESGKLDIAEHEYALSSLLGDCTGIIRTQMGEKGLRFVTDFAPSLPNKLRGDESRVRQVTLNLLTNAVKYTPSGTVTLRVRGEHLAEGRIDLRISVSDTGIGIRQEDMSKLFGEFNRLDGVKNRGIEGTGLGLAISQRLCLLMDGDIAAESEYGKGSTFSVRIPQTVIDSSPFVIDERSPSDISFAHRFTAPDVRVLVVDDLPTNLTVAAGLIAPYRIATDTVLSGEEALRLVKAEPGYDIVFLDHMMPGMDGIEAASRIRRLEGDGFRMPTLIALTANAVSGMKEMFLENGFDDYLSKPIDVARLDDIFVRWIPAERRLKKGEALPERQKEVPPSSGIAAIPGVDVSKGIMFTGGTEAGYLEVLGMFGKDAEERVGVLRDFLSAPDSPEGIAGFTKQAHALKSALAVVGAAEYSAEAARLEAAGKVGDSAAIRRDLPAFIERLAALAQAIRDATRETADGP